MKLTSLAIFATVTAAAPALAEDRRELGAHEHGHGVLNIAIEKARVTMELEAPGMDIVGFEYPAKSPEQKGAVDKATATLGDPLALFKMPRSAGCAVAEAKVAITAEHEGADEHAKGDGKSARRRDGEHAEHDEGPGAYEGHNAFHVTYALDCAKPENLTSIQFDYFKSFAGAEELTVNVVTSKAQNTYEVSRDKPVLDLGGTM